MAVTLEQVRKTASLARLDLSFGQSPENADKAAMRLAGQLDNILAYMDILNEINTDNIEPLYSPMQNIAEPREDVAMHRLTPEGVLQNAPQSQDTFFVVPPAIS